MSAIVGWPFVAVMFLPMAIHFIWKKRYIPADILNLLVWGIVCTLTITVRNDILSSQILSNILPPLLESWHLLKDGITDVI